MDDKKTEQKQHTHHQHDVGYKELLSTNNNFLQLLKSFVKHQDWVNYIDEQNIIRIDKSFISQDYSEKEADLVYKLNLKNTEVIIYVLIELQSTVRLHINFVSNHFHHKYLS